MTIKVSLDINATPPVTVNPDKENVNRGNQTVTWVPAADQPSFTFVGVTFSTDPNPFSPPTITSDPVKMTVTDSNTKSGIDYPYQLTVMSNNIAYKSATLGIDGVGGDPVIHNN